MQIDQFPVLSQAIEELAEILLHNKAPQTGLVSAVSAA
jgi:hypothetical protein